MQKFRIKFPCKPYVRRYIELTFGNPAELSKDKVLYDIFVSKLRKKSFRYDRSSYHAQPQYSAEIEIKLGWDVFYRYGWELSQTDTTALNILMEGKAKQLLYETIRLYRAFNYKITESVTLFQERYGFPEAVWPAESIRKECMRNLKVHPDNMKELVAEIVKKVEQQYRIS
jgi:hypothetical protein